MARNRVIYQSEAVYVTQGAYSGKAGTDTALNYQPLTAKNAALVPTGIRNLDRVQSANYSFSISRQDVNQFGELAAIDRIITETPTVSFDTSYVMANLANESLLGFEVTPSGTANAASKMVSCISGLIDSTTTAHQKDYFILTTKEGSDAIDLTDSGRYESIIGIGNGFLSSYSTEAAVGGLPTASVSVEGMNMNFVNLPYSGYSVGEQSAGALNSAGWGGSVNGSDKEQTLVAITGANPAINPTNGVKVGNETELTSAAFVALPLASGSIATPTNNISALRPGDITLSLSKKTSDALTDLMLDGDTTTSNLIQGADIADAHIQGYTLSFDLSRTPIQRLGTKFAFARPVDFPITSSLSIDAVLADLTTGSISSIINCDDEYDAVIKMRDPRCPNDVTAERPIVAAFVARGLKLDSESFSSSLGDNKSVTLDFSCQVGGPEQKGVGIFMSGYCATE
tara:strand:- start:622 stop:1989 length:1368 start_codon:yes stop_codon:yes gene_type:complete